MMQASKKPYQQQPKKENTHMSQEIVTTMLADLLTSKDIENIFGVSHMTVHDWRRNKQLPYIEIPGGRKKSIRFDKAKVKEWAKTHNKKIINQNPF